jgi:hypothetical protein
MTTRDEKVADEAAALWREVFGVAPPAKADGPAVLADITRRLPELRYDRIRSPYLRPSLITYPRREGEPR